MTSIARDKLSGPAGFSQGLTLAGIQAPGQAYKTFTLNGYTFKAALSLEWEIAHKDSDRFALSGEKCVILKQSY